MKCEEKNSLGLCEEKMVAIADALAYLIIEIPCNSDMLMKKEIWHIICI